MTKKLLTTVALATFLLPVAYDNKAGWKKDEEGKPVFGDDGNPVYVTSEGKESSVKPNTIAQLNGEAKANRERAEAAETKLKEFDGVDIKAGQDAIAKLKDVDLSKMVDAGKLEEVRTELAKDFAEKMTAKDAEFTALQTKLDNTALDAAFSGSKYISENVAIPVEMVKATFGKHFQIKDGSIVPVKEDGTPIYSADDMGRVASFDEALGMFIDKYPQKDAILKAAEHRGSGNGGGGGNDPSGKRTIPRKDFDNMNPGEKAKVATEMREGKVTIA